MTAFKSENLPQGVRDTIARQGHKDNVAKIEKRVSRVDKADLEAAVQKACLQYLELRNIFAWRQNTGAAKFGDSYVRFGIPGLTDIVGMLPDGRFLGVECKRRKGGRQSLVQKEFQRSVEANRGVYILAASVDDLQAGLKAAGA